MNIKLFVFLIVILMLSPGCVKKYHPPTSPAEINGEKMLLGATSYRDILHFFPSWQNEDRRSKPDSALVKAIREIEQPVKITCYVGTWCSDSRRGVPLFMKTLRAADNDNIELEMIGVDRQKDDPDHRALQQDVHRVPTFIVYLHDIEIGRMIEFPMQDNFVKDFLEILKSN